MSVLRLEAIAARDVDRALAAAGPLVLWRDGGGTFAEVAQEDESTLSRSLAFAGVRATHVDVPLPAAPALTQAIGITLAPLSPPAALDMVRVRPLDLGEASARLLRRRIGRRAGPRQRDRCVAILRGQDRMIGWQRRAWAPVRALRDERFRAVLRPVLFDRGATPPERLVFAAEGEIARWAFP